MFEKDTVDKLDFEHYIYVHIESMWDEPDRIEVIASMEGIADYLSSVYGGKPVYESKIDEYAIEAILNPYCGYYRIPRDAKGRFFIGDQ